MARTNIPDWVYAKIIQHTVEETPDEFVTKATIDRIERKNWKK